jgi:outer membrane lipoprotein LolB
MTERRPPAATLLMLLLTLGGCAHLPDGGGDGMSYRQRRVFLEAVDTWELRGRIAIDTGERAFQGRFQWSQAVDRLELTVRSPLGTNVLRVFGPPEALYVEARGDKWRLDSPEAQLSELFGWWLPVTSFRYWLLGVPDPHYRATTELGADTVLEGLRQRLWGLEFASYQVAEGVLVPRRIDLGYGPLEFRVIIDSWAPAP